MLRCKFRGLHNRCSTLYLSMIVVGILRPDYSFNNIRINNLVKLRLVLGFGASSDVAQVLDVRNDVHFSAS